MQATSWVLKEAVRFDRTAHPERHLGDLSDPALLRGAGGGGGDRRPAPEKTLGAGEAAHGPVARRHRQRRVRCAGRARARPAHHARAADCGDGFRGRFGRLREQGCRPATRSGDTPEPRLLYSRRRGFGGTPSTGGIMSKTCLRHDPAREANGHQVSQSQIRGLLMSLRILSGGAAQGLVGAVAPQFEAETGCSIGGTFGAVGAMRDKLLTGEPADLLILTRALIDDLARAGHVVAGSAVDVGTLATAVAVRSGDPAPAVGDAAGWCCTAGGGRDSIFPIPSWRRRAFISRACSSGSDCRRGGGAAPDLPQRRYRRCVRWQPRPAHA